MIVFDLSCAQGGHIFEAWFGSSAAFDDQRARALIACPYCADTDVTKAVMAPRLSAKRNTRSERGTLPVALPADNAPGPARMKQMLGEMAKMQSEMLTKSDWVGKGFSDKARAMHFGETEKRAIHGEATLDQARAMIDDGIAVAPLPFPVVPPEAQN